MHGSYFTYWGRRILVLVIPSTGDKSLASANRLLKKVHPKETLYHRPAASRNIYNHAMVAVGPVCNHAGAQHPSNSPKYVWTVTNHQYSNATRPANNPKTCRGTHRKGRNMGF